MIFAEVLTRMMIHLALMMKMVDGAVLAQSDQQLLFGMTPIERMFLSMFLFMNVYYSWISSFASNRTHWLN